MYIIRGLLVQCWTLYIHSVPVLVNLQSSFTGWHPLRSSEAGASEIHPSSTTWSATDHQLHLSLKQLFSDWWSGQSHDQLFTDWWSDQSHDQLFSDWWSGKSHDQLFSGWWSGHSHDQLFSDWWSGQSHDQLFSDWWSGQSHDQTLVWLVVWPFTWHTPLWLIISQSHEQLSLIGQSVTWPIFCGVGGPYSYKRQMLHIT